MTLIKAEHIKKSFDVHKKVNVLKGVSLSIRQGESIAICGRSGEGKTTLLHILGTLEKPDEGVLHLQGVLVGRQNAYRLRQQSVGFIFQSFNLLEDFTALDNVLMPARIARRATHPQSEAHHHALVLLQEVDLMHCAMTPAKLLSGGERQRVAIARALCNNPPLILADEPTGNLDRTNAENIGKLLMNCVRAKNKGLILVTHDANLAALCDDQYTLNDGMLEK